jgi:hypothetical protein
MLFLQTIDKAAFIFYKKNYTIFNILDIFSFISWRVKIVVTRLTEHMLTTNNRSDMGPDG